MRQIVPHKRRVVLVGKGLAGGCASSMMSIAYRLRDRETVDKQLRLLAGWTPRPTARRRHRRSHLTRGPHLRHHYGQRAAVPQPVLAYR
jgi:hypothetical protein